MSDNGLVFLDELQDADLNPVLKTQSEYLKPNIPIIKPTEVSPDDPDYSKDQFNNVVLVFEGSQIKCVIDESGAPFFAPRDIAVACGMDAPQKSKCLPDGYTHFWFESGFGLFKVVGIKRAFKASQYYKTDRAERFRQFVRDKFLDKTIGPVPSKSGIKFKAIPKYKDYAAGDDGSIWSRKSGEWAQLKVQKNRREYPEISIDGARIYVHRLILITFRGEPQPGHEARHLNDVKADNRLDNLAWGTPAENQDDRRRNDPRFYDPALYRKKLTIEQVREIRNGYVNGVSISELSRVYKIHCKTVRQIVNWEIWKHVE